MFVQPKMSPHQASRAIVPPHAKLDVSPVHAEVHIVDKATVTAREFVAAPNRAHPLVRLGFAKVTHLVSTVVGRAACPRETGNGSKIVTQCNSICGYRSAAAMVEHHPIPPGGSRRTASLCSAHAK